MNLKWKGLYDKTSENLSIEQTGDEIRVRSKIEGTFEGRPIEMSYEMILSGEWSWKEFILFEDKKEIYHLTREYEYDPPYIDFILTPFTNTLPILKEDFTNRKETMIEVLYIGYPKHELAITKQEYEKVGERNYRFKNLSTGFEEVIEVDEKGFVINYPSLYQRIE